MSAISGTEEVDGVSSEDPSREKSSRNVRVASSVTTMELAVDSDSHSDQNGESKANSSSLVAIRKLPNDTYTMFFVSELGSQAFYYALYIFALKLALFSLLYIETYGDGRTAEVLDKKVTVAQFLLLPVAVGIQDDLISAYSIFVNVQYSASIQRQCGACASQWKFRLSNACRCIDGFFSLIVNFMVLISATEVLSLFLNFAALSFIQNIDNLAFSLSADGFFTDQLLADSETVLRAKLPEKHLRGKRARFLDTALFIGTLVMLVIFWAMISFGNINW